MEHSRVQETGSNEFQSLKVQGFCRGTDYSRHIFTLSEKLRQSVKPFAIILVVSFLCYDNLLFSFLLVPIIPLYLKSANKRFIENRKWKLNLQFGEGISCISAALEAGYSVENAMQEAYNDMKLSLPEDELIMQEFYQIIVNIRNNGNIEESFNEFADRSGLDDIRSFADIFSTAKRTGGNVIQVIRSTSDVIHTRVELKRELRTLIASKKYEADIMKLVPVFMLGYLKFFSPDMVSSLYGNLFGISLMSGVLVAYLLLCMLSDHLIKFDL